MAEQHRGVCALPGVDLRYQGLQEWRPQTPDRRLSFLERDLMTRYRLLYNYATACATGFASVRIRLAKAHEAAKAGDKTLFEELFTGIERNIDEHTDVVLRARKELKDLVNSTRSGLVTVGHVGM